MFHSKDSESNTHEAEKQGKRIQYHRIGWAQCTEITCAPDALLAQEEIASSVLPLSFPSYIQTNVFPEFRPT